MKINTWKIDKALVRNHMQDDTPRLVAMAPRCLNSSPKPFVLVTDGKIGLTAWFTTDGELQDFKRQISLMSF